MNSLYCVEICHAGGMKGKDIFPLMILNIQFAGFCIPLNSPSSPLQRKSLEEQEISTWTSRAEIRVEN